MQTLHHGQYAMLKTQGAYKPNISLHLEYCPSFILGF